MVNLTNNSFKQSSCMSNGSSANSAHNNSQLVLNLENVLYIEDRLSTMSELLKVIQSPPSAASIQACTSIIELCEDWWEALR
jgi:uncharacterized protein (DUF1499 family)